MFEEYVWDDAPDFKDPKATQEVEPLITRMLSMANRITSQTRTHGTSASTKISIRFYATVQLHRTDLMVLQAASQGKAGFY